MLSGKSSVQLENGALRVGLTNEKDLPLAITLATQPALLRFFHSDTPVAAGEPIPANALIIFSGADIADASASLDMTTNRWVISLTFTPQGRLELADYTQAHIGSYLVIARDDRVLSAPKVNSAIPGGKAVIDTDFDQVTARIFAAQIKSGAMPVPLVLVK